MQALFKYSAAVTSVRAGIGRLLSGETWDNLLSCQNTKQVYTQLNDTPYQEVFGQESFRLERSEIQIQQYFARNARIPFPFLSGSALKVVEWYVKRLDLDNLISLIRGISHHIPSGQRKFTLIALGDLSNINWVEWADIDSMDVLVGRLESTADGEYYAKTIRNALNEYRRQQRAFILEIALYKAYFRRLRSLMDELSSGDKKQAKAFLVPLIDYTNLLWAYRYHIFFHLEPELIHAYTLTAAAKVDRAVVQQIISDVPMTEVLTAVWGTTISDWHWLKDTSPRDALIRLETLFRSHLFFMAQNTIGTFKFNYGVILAYLVLLETEGRDLITLMEGIHNGWSVENIMNSMIAERIQT